MSAGKKPAPTPKPTRTATPDEIKATAAAKRADFEERIIAHVREHEPVHPKDVAKATGVPTDAVFKIAKLLARENPTSEAPGQPNRPRPCRRAPHRGNAQRNPVKYIGSWTLRTWKTAIGRC